MALLSTAVKHQSRAIAQSTNCETQKQGRAIACVADKRNEWEGIWIGANMPVANRIVRPPCPLAGRGLLSLSLTLWKLVSLTGTLNFSHGLLVCLPRTHQQHNWLLVGLPWPHPAPTSALTGVPAPDAHSSTTGCWWVCPGSTTLSHTGCWCTCPGLHPAPHTLTLLNTTHGGRCNSSSRGRSSRGG